MIYNICMDNRIILHIDANSFFASVESIKKPHLKNVPMAVGGDLSSRHGIILAKNELAKAYGIQTAETVVSAKRKCPSLVIVPPSHDEYVKYSRLLNEIYLEYTDLVEPFGIDESWLDITHSLHLFTDNVSYIGAAEFADDIRKRIERELGLTVSIGVSFNKSTAKLGSDYKKPNATTKIEPSDFCSIVHPLPVSSLLYVGRSAEKLLSELRIRTVGQLAAFDRGILLRKLGKLGGTIHDYANGIDNDEVSSYYTKKEVKSISSGNTFPYDLTTRYDIESSLMILTEEVGYRLRSNSLSCSTVSLSVKYPDLKVVQRQLKISPSCSSRTLFSAAMSLIDKYKLTIKPVRAMTLAVSSLCEGNAKIQLSAFDSGQDEIKSDKLDKAVDSLKERFGNGAIVHASIINKNSSSDKPT